MNSKYLLLLLAVMLSCFFHKEATAQKCLIFKYDAEGNRIKKTVSDNCANFRDMADIQEVTAIMDWTVCPNPTHGIFKIVKPTHIGHEAYYKLYNMNGVVLLDDKLYDDEKEIDIGGFPRGVYCLKITCGEDVISRVILKQ